MGAQVDEVLDLVNSTLKDLGDVSFEQIAQRLTDYEIMRRLLKKERILIKSGTGFQRRVMLDHSGSARHVQMFEGDNTSITDVLKVLNVPWRHAMADHSIERREILMNSGASELVDLLKVRRLDAVISITEELETKGWSAPASSANVTDAWGIPYWITKDTSEGFNGGNPSGFSTKGGIDSTPNKRWKNWTAQYSAATKTDLIRRMRRAHARTNFKSPENIKDLRTGRGERFRIYMNLETLLLIEELAEAQNDQLGRDIASMDGSSVFKKNPLIQVPELASDATDPVYMLDTNTIFIAALAGDVLQESGMLKKANAHNVFESFIDLTYNFVCVDPRRNAVISK